MIGVPFNDHQCLGAISEILAAMAQAQDLELLELASQYPTTAELVDYIRSLPQRDDLFFVGLAIRAQGNRVHAAYIPITSAKASPSALCCRAHMSA